MLHVGGARIGLEMKADPARTPVIVDGLRTPFGRYNGALREVRPDDMAAHVISALIERNGVDPGSVDDVILGAANQAGEDNRNVGRMAALLAGMPVEVPGSTVNRLCGSGMNAVINAAHAIVAGDGSLFVAGGVESMTRAPFVMAKPSAAFPRGEQTLYDTTLGWRFTNPRLAEAYYPYSMGETAENVVERCGVTREEQDAFALESHRRWAAASEAGRFADEVVPIEAPGVKRGEQVQVSMDEHPRPDTTIEQLAALKPAFKRDASGSVTAGNSSGINDGAAALLITSEARARQLGWRPIMRMLSSAVAGVDPATMGLGPIPASRLALDRAGLTAAEMDLVELNEAFAAQAIPVMRELELDPAKTNVNGGAIAIGHPLGASGARLVATLAHEMRRRGARHGLATMCIGVGQGIASVWEAVE
jgi:3-oxoadipyl-CoA thiolase